MIRHLTLSKEQQLAAFEKFDAFPALKQVHQGPFFNQPIEFLGGQKARLIWRDTANSIKASKVFKHDAIAEEIVNAELDLVLTRGKKIPDALNDAQALIERRARR